MRFLIIGAGLVGQAVAQMLVAQGHYVIGTTTTSAKVEKLQANCSEVAVLMGEEQEKVAAAAAGCEAVVITVSPKFSRTTSPEARLTEYKRVLVRTCRSATAVHSRCLFASSFSVYGDGGSGPGPITEASPLSTASEPSTVCYQAAEKLVLNSLQGCVLRFPDIYGGENDLDYGQRLGLAHKMMGGRVPFSGDALLYRLHCLDAARSIVHTLRHDLVGAFNVCLTEQLPPTNQAVFDRLAAEAGLEPLVFLSQIKLPSCPILADKIAATGFTFEYTDYDFR